MPYAMSAWAKWCTGAYRRDKRLARIQCMDCAVVQGELTHSGQAELDQQAEDAIRRDIGKAGGFGWAVDNPEGSVALLDAATLAHYLKLAGVIHACQTFL